MRHRIGTHLTCDLDLALGDQRPRDRRAEQVQPLVERVGAHHREDVLLDEFLAQIVDEDVFGLDTRGRSEEHTSELQSLMRISYAVFCLKKKKNTTQTCIIPHSITRQ